ncbi:MULTISPECIES: hypothetical protein [unclassified Streptomyces]|uniref:hypothetical protein n=1 Tax=unclassified Streptomyces TaxID=2593676 RepID=UPI003D9343DA
MEDAVCGWRLTWQLPDLRRSVIGAAVPRESPLCPVGPGTQRARRAQPTFCFSGEGLLYSRIRTRGEVMEREQLERLLGGGDETSLAALAALRTGASHFVWDGV